MGGNMIPLPLSLYGGAGLGPGTEPEARSDDWLASVGRPLEPLEALSKRPGMLAPVPLPLTELVATDEALPVPVPVSVDERRDELVCGWDWPGWENVWEKERGWEEDDWDGDWCGRERGPGWMGWTSGREADEAGGMWEGVAV